DYSPVLGESGQPIGVIAMVVETTEPVQVHQQLAQSEERFRALTTATSSITYRMNADWTELLQLEGRGVLPQLNLPARNWIDALVMPEDHEAVRAAIDAAVHSRTPFHNEHRITQTDGSVRWLESRAVPLLDAQGQIVEWFGSATDVTERYRANDQRLLQQQRQLRVFEQAPGF